MKCHYRFEQKRGFHDSGSVDCPRCQGEARRLFSAPPVIFKGAGFYVTDHRKPGATETETKPAEKTVEKVEAKKTDVKPSTTPSPGG
jgi:putative FmdB family regulatory protein